MKQKIIKEVDKMLSNGEKITYRELGYRLDTVASTITYQFGSKSNLISEYLDYKFTTVYEKEVFSNFTELLIFSLNTNKNLANKLGDEITVSALTNIQERLLTKHYNSFSTLYKRQFDEIDDIKMMQAMTFVQLIAWNSKYYSKVLKVNLEMEGEVRNLVLNILR